MLVLTCDMNQEIHLQTGNIPVSDVDSLQNALFCRSYRVSSGIRGSVMASLSLWLYVTS